MKKIFTLAAIAAVALSFTLTSCSKSAEDYVNEQKELAKELAEAVKAGDEAKVKELTEKGTELQKEVDAKCKEDAEFKKAYDEAAAKAAAELAKELAQ